MQKRIFFLDQFGVKNGTNEILYFYLVWIVLMRLNVLYILRQNDVKKFLDHEKASQNLHYLFEGQIWFWNTNQSWSYDSNPTLE